MLWNTAVAQALINTCLVSAGAAIVAVGMGWLLAILVTCVRIPFARTWSLLMLGMALVPIYVQAAAWSAGLGVQGWLRLSQVAASLSPTWALLSVMWVHGIAAAPVCFLLGKIGLGRSMDSSARQAILDFGVWFALCRVLTWNAMPWAAASVLWSVAMTANDMVVTNLYQVPTLAETMYQQVQFQEVRVQSVFLNCMFAFIVALLTTIGFKSMCSDLGAEELETRTSWNAVRIPQVVQGIGACIALCIVIVVAIFPMLNLMMRSGWKTQVVDGKLSSNWSLIGVQHALDQIRSFRAEFVWSFQLAACASALAIVLSGMLVWTIHGWSLRVRGQQRGTAWVDASALGLMVFFLALPGPLVNLLILKLFTFTNADWLVFLSDRTLIGPVLALQFRCLPMAFGILWLGKERFYRRHERELLMDAGLPLRMRAWVWASGLQVPVLLAITITFMVAFADLATYLLVLPPGVTTVAMRMFDLLHYGVKNQEAALAFLLFVMSFAVVGAMLFAESKTQRV